MLEYIVPVVFYCAVVGGEINNCNGTTKIYSETLDAVATPGQCLVEGNVRAAQYIGKWHEDHPNKELEFRVKCERSSKRT